MAKQELMDTELSNGSITNADNQEDTFRKNIKDFFLLSKDFMAEGFCPVRDIMATSFDKWSLFVLYNLGYTKVLRFNQLKKYIPDISSRMLSVTLKRMEEHDIIHRQVYAEVPPRVEYSLTPFGKELGMKIIELSNWYISRHPRTSEVIEKKK